MNLTLKIWRQKNSKATGSLETYQVKDISSEMSFLEMFDVLNEQLIVEGKEPIAFDHDCREGICGMCSMYINGQAHGPWQQNTTCQLHMRAFKDGDTIVVEPWRSAAFPVVKDLVVDRSSFDRIIQAGGYISVNTGNAVDANAIPIDKKMLIMHLWQQLVSDVVLVWQLAKMVVPCFLLEQKFLNWLYCLRVGQKENQGF